MAVSVSGMFGSSHTYFTDSPVVIDIGGLSWPANSPFNIVRVEVIYNNAVVGSFYADTGGLSSISFDISSALRAIWSSEDFHQEVSDAQTAANGSSASQWVRSYKSYSLIVYTEYIDSTDGELTQTSSGLISGGRCAIGGFTEWERSSITNKEDADLSYLENSNGRNGDASTKPTISPERIGKDSITSWVDISNSGTKSVFYPKTTAGGSGQQDEASAHAPLVLRDSIPYTDFLFVNRRGAVETCSALMLEEMSIEVESKQYNRIERPTFKPSRSLMAISSGGRRSWSMSSGHQTREWAEWWTMEFLKSRRWWMLYRGPGQVSASYVPVVVEPAKKDTGIYDRSKQQLPSVEFTVTLALEG